MSEIKNVWREAMNSDRLEVIKDDIICLDPTLAGKEDTEGFRAAVLVFSAACLGADVDVLIAFTGYARDFVARVSQRMRGCGLWDEGFVNDDWYIEGKFQDQIIPPVFWTHVLAAQGLVTVVGHTENRKPIFAAVENGRRLIKQ